MCNITFSLKASGVLKRNASPDQTNEKSKWFVFPILLDAFNKKPLFKERKVSCHRSKK